MREELGVEAELIKGHGGIFEVKVDGVVVAKKSLGGFPTEEEVVAAVEKATQGVGV